MKIVKKIMIYALLAFGSFVMIFPFLYMLSTALKTPQEVIAFPPVWIPKNIFNLQNFALALSKAPFVNYFINSIVITLACVILTGFTTIVGAFAFSRLKFPGRDLIFSLLLSLMMVPFEMLVITNYKTIADIGLIDTKLALIIPFTSSIFYTYILRNFFLSIPDTLYYSARIDGASNWKYLWRVMVPIAKPSLFTIMLLNAITTWNSFIWTMLVINTDINRTLPLGVFKFSGEFGGDNEIIMAGSTMIILPMIILFIFSRKYIVSGVSRGGIKG